jgi:integrase
MPKSTLLSQSVFGRVRSVNKLRWEDVHGDYLLLYTRKARNSDLKELRVPINSVLKDVLSQLPQTGEYVFINGYRSKLLHTLCRLARVKYFPCHALRHFGAS